MLKAPMRPYPCHRMVHVVQLSTRLARALRMAIAVQHVAIVVELPTIVCPVMAVNPDLALVRRVRQ